MRRGSAKIAFRLHGLAGDSRIWLGIPKLDLRRVAALGEIDADGIALAVGVIIFAKLVAQAGGLDAHDGIDIGVEGLGTIENFEGDIVALQPLAASGERFIDDVIEEPLAAP